VRTTTLRSLGWLAGESLTLAGRTLRHHRRAPEVVVFGLLQPVMFLLLFRYILGAAIRMPAGREYVDYLLAGVFVQTIAMNAVASGIGHAEDRQLGVADRLRSLPVRRMAAALGRVLATLVHNAFAAVVLLVVGLVIGFSPGGDLWTWLAAAALLAAFSFTCAWIGVIVGETSPTPEAAQAAGFVLLFPLVIASTAFVPAFALPDGVREFVQQQPLSRIMDAERALMLGDPAGSELWIALAWCAAILAGAVWLARRLLEREAAA